jgi:hypothetical protein
MGWSHLKILESVIFTWKLSYNYNVDSSFSSNHGPRGSEGATVRKTIFTSVYIEKEIFSRTSRPISVKLGTNHPWAKGILNCSNKGPGLLQRGDNNKNAKIWRGHRKKFPWEPLTQKSFWHSVYSSLYKLWSLRIKVGDTRRETIFTFVYLKESFKM